MGGSFPEVSMASEARAEETLRTRGDGDVDARRGRKTEVVSAMEDTLVLRMVL